MPPRPSSRKILKSPRSAAGRLPSSPSSSSSGARATGRAAFSTKSRVVKQARSLSAISGCAATTASTGGAVPDSAWAR
ncbi:MAG: hypothetical protein HY721_31620 [Planctomycetes bacterium]|nr:hypothetical protein [Planctomycetota bacterium]